MNALDEIESKLQKYPDVRYDRTSSSIAVYPGKECEFSVSVEKAQNDYTVYFEGWHEEFTCSEQAMECFAFGLSDECRLKTVYRGSRPVQWTVECLSPNGWIKDSTTGLLLSPFWLERTCTYKQNRLIKRKAI